MATLATLVVKLVADAGEFVKGIEGAGKQLDAVGGKMKNVGGDLSAISAPLIGVGAAALVAGTQFNKGMANVISLAPEASAQIEAMIPGVQNLAVAMGTSTGDMTTGLYQVISATGLTDDTLANLETNARAAAAGLATTSEAIALTSAVTKGYGDTSAEATQKAADLALRTVQLGQTTFPELAASIGRVVPLAASLGVSQEELFASMATASGVTGNAAEVSTQLRGVLQSLMAPSADMAGLMKSLGYESGTAMIESLGLIGTIKAITGAAETAGAPLQKYIGSIEGQTAAMALSGPLSGDYTTKLTAMGSAAGSTDAAFKAQTEGLNESGFATQQLGAKTQVTLEKLGNALAPALLQVVEAAGPLLDMITGLIERFTAMDPATQSTIISVLGIVAVLGPLLMVVGSVVSAIGGLVSFFGMIAGVVAPLVAVIGGGIGALVAALGTLLLPITLIIAAAALLYLAWSTNFLGIRDLVGAVVEQLKTLFSGIGKIFSGDFEGGIAKIGEALEGLQKIFDNVKAAIWNKLLEVGTAIVEGIKSGISSAWDAFVDWAKSKLEGLLKAVLGLFGIHSPSTVFAGIGENLVMGMRVGMAREMAGLEGDLRRMAAVTANVDLAGGGGQGGRVQVVQHFHGPADYAVVRRATEDGIAAAARARGYR